MRARQAILAQNPELPERELIKMASWATAVAGSLRRRGVEDLTAALTAEVAVAAFRVAFETWVGPGKKRDLPDLIRESFDRLRERRWRQERVVGSQPGCQRVHVLELAWQRLFLPDLSPPFLMEMALFFRPTGARWIVGRMRLVAYRRGALGRRRHLEAP